MLVIALSMFDGWAPLKADVGATGSENWRSFWCCASRKLCWCRLELCSRELNSVRRFVVRSSGGHLSVTSRECRW